MLDLKTATLEELEAASRQLSTQIHELQEQRRPIDDEMSRRHQIFQALKHRTPHEMDAAILAGGLQAPVATDSTTEVTDVE